MNNEALRSQLEAEGCEIRAVALRADPPEGRKRRFRASTFSLDRHGTRIRPEGIGTKNFKRNPVFVWAHDAYGSFFGPGPQIESMLGRVTKLELTEVGSRAGGKTIDDVLDGDRAVNRAPSDDSTKALDIDVEYSQANPKAQLAMELVDEGVLSMVSIGIRPLDVSQRDENGKTVYVIDRSDLLEISQVPIGSNPDALKLALQSSMAFQRFLTAQGAIPPSPEADAGSPSPVEEAVRRAVSDWTIGRAVRSCFKR